MSDTRMILVKTNCTVVRCKKSGGIILFILVIEQKIWFQIKISTVIIH